MNEEIKEKTHIKKKKIKSGNSLLYGFLVFFILGYGIFFSSKLWLKAPYEDVPITPIGKTITEEDRSVTINSWKYSREEKKMEIMATIENLALDNIETYKWSVKTASSTLNTNVIMEGNELVVIEVTDVPNNWAEAALYMELKDRDKNKNTDFKLLKMYTNEANVKAVKEIKRKSVAGYKKDLIFAKIDGYKAQLKSMEKTKIEIMTAIKLADKKISDLTDEMKYQTRSEQMKTGEKISALAAEKESLLDNLNNKKAEIKETKKKIKIQESILRNEKGGVKNVRSGKSKKKQKHS